MMEWIKSQTDWDQHVNALERQFDPLLSVSGLNFDAERLYGEVQDLFHLCPPTHWRSQPPGALWGLSLSYNPQAPQHEWPFGSFGHPRYQQYAAVDYFKAPEQDRHLAPRGDYLDSLGFCKTLTEVEKLPALKTLLGSFRMPVVRCTVRVLDGTKVLPTGSNSGGMHQDDSPFEVMRLNLCITGSADFGLQYAGYAPISLRPGEHCVVNTDVDHRVWVGQRSNVQRIHLVIGLAPWLDYDPQEGVWTPNAHFGNIHPYDLVRQGKIMRTP